MSIQSNVLMGGHSHHGVNAVPRQAMQKNLEKHGKDWCEKLAEGYEMSVDTIHRQSCYIQQVGKKNALGI